MDELRAAGNRLIELAGPFIECDDFDGLAKRLQDAWSPECLRLLLTADQDGIVQVAAICLGLVGGTRDAKVLAELLHHEADTVVQSAEHALWTIWFRAGGPQGRAALSRIAQFIDDGDTENVIPILNDLIRSQPGFSEAYHQRSQAFYLAADYEQSLRDARRAFELNPLHFGALVNQAHCYAAMDRMGDALRLYREVLRIHPRMPDIRRTIQMLRRSLALTGTA